MKKTTYVFYIKRLYPAFFIMLCLMSAPCFSQTLSGASVEFVELSQTKTVNGSDQSLDATPAQATYDVEFKVSGENYYVDVDGDKIIIGARNGTVISAVTSITFNFSGGTFSSIIGASFNPGASTGTNTSGVSASFTATSVTISGIQNKDFAQGYGLGNMGTVVFDITTAGVANTAPVIDGASSGQNVNDNSTISPFSSITTTDADGDNLSATITLDDNAKGILTGTGLSGTGPYTIASTTPSDLQSKLRALVFDPTDNRTATSETTTFTVVINDGTDTDTDNTTTVISSTVAPTVTSISVPTNGNYLTSQNLDFTVNFDENITVNTTGGTPQIAITIGATTRQAVYQSGSGTSALVFRYTVQSGDSDTDGIAVGTLAANGGTLKDAASNDAVLTLNSIGNTTNVLVGIETVTWSGSTDNDWNTASNWSPSVVPPTNANVIIPSSLTNYPTASSAVTFNSLTINSGASFIPQSTVTGTVTYKRSLPTTNWYLVSPPVAGETLEDIIANHTLASGNGGNLGLAPYSNTDGPAWFYLQIGNTGTITNGTGVSIKLATPSTVSFTGTANTSNIAKAISTGSRTNYNLVGNPYTSYINSVSFTAANSSILTSETIWLWNGTQYITRNALTPFEIAPGQAFFVEAATSNNVIFAFSNQSHQNSDTFMRQEPIPSIELSVKNNDIKRSTQVFYVSGKTTGYDRSYDSKMFGEDSSGLAVFTELLTNNQGKQLAIQTLPDNDYENMVVPVGLRALNGEEVTFSINTKNIPTNIKVYLEDRINNVFTNLSEENYTIKLSENSNNTGQFYLHTSAKNLNPGSPNETKGIELFKPENNQVIIVKGLQTQNATLKMFSLSGKQVFNTVLNSDGYSEVTIPKLASGVYLVELVSDSIKTNAKIILD